MILSHYYKHLLRTSSSPVKICLNSNAYSKVAKSSGKVGVAGKKRSKEDKVDSNEEIEVPSEFLKHFKTTDKALLQLLPRRFFKKISKQPDNFYLVGNDSAKTISSVINKLPSSPKVPLVEINPGIGTLTNHLLESKIQNLQLIEAQDTPFKHLNETHGDRIPCNRADFIGMGRLEYIDKKDNGDRISKLFEGFNKKNWNDDISSRIIVSTGSLKFYQHLINDLITGSTLFSYGRHEIFAVIPPILYFILTSTNQLGYMLYRSYSVLFQIFFEFEFITKLKREDFLPWPSKKIRTKFSKLYQIREIDNDSLYFVRIVPRKNLFDHCPMDQLNMLKFFIKQNCFSRKNRIIPAFEKYIPYAGKQIILDSSTPQTPEILHKNVQLPQFCADCYALSSKDYYPDLNIFTEFGELSPNQLLTLFNQFRNLDGYKESSFVTNMELHLLAD